MLCRLVLHKIFLLKKDTLGSNLCCEDDDKMSSCTLAKRLSVEVSAKVNKRT